jgi:hypothetical protein
MKEFMASFMHRNNEGELEQTTLIIKASSKTQALKTAKLEAKNRDWRFLDLTP